MKKKIIILITVIVISVLITHAWIMQALKMGSKGLKWINGQVKSAMQLELLQLGKQKEELEELYKQGKELREQAQASKRMYQMYKEKYKEVKGIKNFNWKNTYQMLNLINNFDKPRFWLTGIAETNKAIGRNLKSWLKTTNETNKFIKDYIGSSKLVQLETRKKKLKKENEKIDRKIKLLKEDYKSALEKLTKIEKDTEKKDVGTQTDIISIQGTVAKKREKIKELKTKKFHNGVKYNKLEEKQERLLIKGLKTTSPGNTESKIKFSYFD